jgi:hypothetical protein
MKANDDPLIKGTHILMSLKSYLKIDLAMLNEPNLLISLIEENSTKMITSTGKLKDIVQLQININN